MVLCFYMIRPQRYTFSANCETDGADFFRASERIFIFVNFRDSLHQPIWVKGLLRTSPCIAPHSVPPPLPSRHDKTRRSGLRMGDRRGKSGGLTDIFNGVRGNCKEESLSSHPIKNR